MSKDAVVKARVDFEDKELATAVLKEIGLKVSDLIRMTLKQTAKLKRLPFSTELSQESLEAIREVESGKAQRASHLIELSLPAGAPDLSA